MSLEQSKIFFAAAFKEKKEKKPGKGKRKRKSRKGEPEDEPEPPEDESLVDEFIDVTIPEPTIPEPKKFNRAPSFLLPQECISPFKNNAFASDDDDDDDDEEEEEGPPRKVSKMSVGDKPGTSGCSGMTR